MLNIQHLGGGGGYTNTIYYLPMYSCYFRISFLKNNTVSVATDLLVVVDVVGLEAVDDCNSGPVVDDLDT